MLLTVTLLLGCETLLPIAGKVLGGADDGISVDAQIGDRENEVNLGKAHQSGAGDIDAKGNAQVKIENTQETADAKIEKADKVVLQNIPPWVMVLLLIGWILPTPNSMWSSLKNKFRRKKT